MKSSLASMSNRSRLAQLRSSCVRLGIVLAITTAQVSAEESSVPSSHRTQSDAAVMDSSRSRSHVSDPADEEHSAQREYEQAKKNLLPLGPAEIRDFRNSRDAAQAAGFGGAPPQLKNREVSIGMAPGEQAPTVRLAPPFIAGVIFVDTSGAPWPITSVEGAAASEGMFSVGWDAEGKVPPHNLLTVRPLTNHVSANAVVTLQGCELPVGIVFDADSRNEHGLAPTEIDGLLTVKLWRLGPAAQRPAVGPLPEPALNPRLRQFLYDTPPEGARDMPLDPPVGKAWALDGHLYLRTDRALRWPAWTAQAKAPGGVAIYELPSVPSLLVSIDGQTVSILVGGSDKSPSNIEVQNASGS
jgi:intracellular multiplication protein IcmK